MLGRIFGRGKNEPDQAVCASCGRTLLAGEWTQQLTDENGDERLICSLCSHARPAADGEEVRGAPLPANAGKVRESRSDSDAFWKALKDKDLEISRLQSMLARAEAEKQELLGRLARSGHGAADADEGPAGTGVETSAVAPGDTPELAAATWGETPEELAAALAEFAEPAGTPDSPAHDERQSPPAIAFEDTQPIPAVGDEPSADESEAGSEEPAPEPADVQPASETEDATEAPVAPILTVDQDDAEARAAAGAAAAEREADTAASLTLLQRGVDLLNVSTVPRKIAETNEHLGLPSVHVGFDGQTIAATFLWTMGWYRFTVDIDGGSIRMDERGYEERRDLQPNAGVRADGTVHLAPAQISRAAAQKQAMQPEQTPEPADEPSAEAEPPSVAAQKAPEFVSKSLLGQRSDDEPWDGAKARDFNWDR